jgi:hypothetical protein
MKPTTINVQITKCPKQYEAVRIGMDASLDAGETVESAIKAATEQLNALYAEMYTPNAKPAQTAEKQATTGAEQATGAKEKLVFEDKRVQQIVNRIEREPEKGQEIIAKALKFYETDEKVMQVLRLAAKLA